MRNNLYKKNLATKMKIASNKLSALFNYYTTELTSIYDDHELMAVFELVCWHFLGYSKSQTKLNFNENLNQSDVLNIYNIVAGLKKGHPIQYALGEVEFSDLKFHINSFTLIPRPETEELVDIIINSNLKPTTILDIGTGSGCIALSLKHCFPEARVLGTDVSNEALDVSKRNADRNNLQVDFLCLDILIQDLNPNTFFSMIVSNPPYIIESEAKQMDDRVLKHEPHLALFVKDNDPIIFYKRIIDLCKHYLLPNGVLYFELNPLFAIDVKNYADASNIFISSEILNDMSGKQRFFMGIKGE